MGKIQRGLRISAIVEFFIAVVCTIILYLNKKQRINIQFLNIKEIALLAITLCLLVIIEEIILFVFAGVKIVKKGYHNVNYKNYKFVLQRRRSNRQIRKRKSARKIIIKK